MNKLWKIAALSIALLLLASPALAAEEPPDEATGGAAREVLEIRPFGVTFACALIIFGAAFAISKIGSSAVENMARQPEVATSISTTMIIAAALIEGITFFALIVCMLRLFFPE